MFWVRKLLRQQKIYIRPRDVSEFDHFKNKILKSTPSRNFGYDNRRVTNFRFSDFEIYNFHLFIISSSSNGSLLTKSTLN